MRLYHSAARRFRVSATKFLRGATAAAGPGNAPLIPYGGIQFVALVAMILMLAHLVTLLTGRPFTGRQGFPG